MSNRKMPLAVLFFVGLVTGFGLSALTPDALGKSVAVAPIGLGTPASEIVKHDGPPRTITWGPEKQVWHYVDKSGAMRPRYEVNQGMVVVVHPTR